MPEVKKLCYAYEIEQKNRSRTQRGNFWVDFLNFDKTIETSGWQFDAIFVNEDDIVIYKPWSGKSNIHRT